jgi:hypothetical protein
MPVGGVDALPARTRRPVDVHPDLVVAHHHLDVLHLGDHRHRRKGRVSALRRVEGRDADEAVHADLALEVAVGVFPGDGDGRRLDAGFLPRQ